MQPDPKARNARNFTAYPPRGADQIEQHSVVRTWCNSLANTLVDTCPEGRELSLALTNLEQVMFWANAAISREGR